MLRFTFFNCVCLLSEAGQVVHSGLMRAFFLRKTAAPENGANESGESEAKQRNCRPENQNNELKNAGKCSLSHYIRSFDPLLMQKH